MYIPCCCWEGDNLQPPSSLLFLSGQMKAREALAAPPGRWAQRVCLHGAGELPYWAHCRPEPLGSDDRIHTHGVKLVCSAQDGTGWNLTSIHCPIVNIDLFHGK